MTCVLGNACILTPALYRRLEQLTQAVVGLGFFSPKSGKMEQKALRVQETCKISLEFCPLLSCMLWLSGHTVKAVPAAARGAQGHGDGCGTPPSLESTWGSFPSEHMPWFVHSYFTVCTALCI